ncbi:MAG: hypothetical protein LBG89_00500 [Rickettsiales bacterium]|jgi:hypothetical protein|nr:hypothetical protein [Rickettsiales bacterium]
MKIILSRKGFDSSAGKMANPILPDGTLLSLPIPDPDSGRKYSDISYAGKTYWQIIKELNPDFDGGEFCHLDPDIRNDCMNSCPADWRPAFGQQAAALTHLRNAGIGIGDLFLFFGWFRQTLALADGTLQFDKSDREGRHIIYGFMEVGDIIKGTKDIAKICPWHPHSKNEAPESFFSDDNNWLFMPKDRRYGTLEYSDKRVLTKRGASRSKWTLPEFFKSAEFSSVCTPGWTADYFQKTGQWQELVITDPSAEISAWAAKMIV